MTISEMVITAMVASSTTVYIECEGKRYRDAVELANEHGDRFIKGATVHPGGGIEIELLPEFDTRAILDLQDTIDAGTIEAPSFQDDPGTIDPRDWILDEAFEPDGLLDGPPPAEEVLGANE